MNRPLGVVALLLCAVPAAAQPPTDALRTLSLDDLMRQEVTTVSRVPEPVSTTPAAVFVITQEDIRRSGATSVPEALRLAPGVQVSRIDGGKYSIGIRGFADRLARSMLVLIDGRAVYSPLFAGTYWEVQDVMLADVDRIEVIRGPGGTLWGANAVNGIINIITKDAAETQGALVAASAGTNLWGPFGARYGWTAGPELHYRAFAQVTGRRPEFHADGSDADGIRMVTTGLRLDWRPSSQRTLTLEANAYRAALDEPSVATVFVPPYSIVSQQQANLSGVNVLTRLTGTARRLGSYQIQTFYDRTDRHEMPVGEARDTFDIDFQNVRAAGTRQSLVFGVGYRVSTGVISAVSPSGMFPSRRTDNLFTAFVQDDVSLMPRRLRLVVGSKFEHNDYSGGEIQPSARLVWTLDAANTFVASVARAVRTPSRVETDYTTASLVSPAAPTFVRLNPNPDFDSEKLVAFEAGYRTQIGRHLYFTASSFFNRVSGIVSTELGSSFVEDDGQSPARVILPILFGNGLRGTAQGGELTADLRIASWWRWSASYSHDRIELNKRPGSADVSQERRNEGLTPRHQATLRSSLDLPHRLSIDAFLSYSSALPAGPIPEYTASRLRVAYLLTPTLELAVVGSDLNRPHHLEWTSSPANVEIQRAVTVQLVWSQGTKGP